MPRNAPQIHHAPDADDAPDDHPYEAIPITFALDTFPGLLFATNFMTPPVGPSASSTSNQQQQSQEMSFGDAASGSLGLTTTSDAFITQSIALGPVASSAVGSARSLKAQPSSGAALGGTQAAAETMPVSLEQLKSTYRNWNKDFQILLHRLKQHENAVRIAAAAAPPPAPPTAAAAAASGNTAAAPSGGTAVTSQVSSGFFSSEDDRQQVSDDESDSPELLESFVTSQQGSFQIGGQYSVSLAAAGITPARRGGPSSKPADHLSDFIAEFESEVAEGVAAILESRTDVTKPFVHPLFDCDHMYKHRGVVYNFFAQERSILDYFGSVENACKVLSCEMRAYRHLVKSTPLKSTAAVPLVALVKLQGYAVMAWAACDALHEDNIVAGPSISSSPQMSSASFSGPLGGGHGSGGGGSGAAAALRVMTKHSMRGVIEAVCEEAFFIPSERNHQYVSPHHRSSHKHTPLVGPCELTVVHSEEEGKLYLYNVWKLFPPVDVPRTSTSLQIVSPRSNAGTVDAPATGMVRNRYHFVNRKCEQYVMFLPQALKRMHDIGRNGGEDLFVDRRAFSSLDQNGEGAEAARRATMWLMQNQVPLAAAELLDLSEGVARRDKPLSCATVKAVMHDHGVNIRFLSAVYKAIVTAIEERAKGDDDKNNNNNNSSSGSNRKKGGAVSGPESPTRRQSSTLPPVNQSAGGPSTSAPVAAPGGAATLVPALALKKEPTTVPTPKKQGSMIGRKSQSKVKLNNPNHQKEMESNQRQISTVENNSALHLIRVEAVARSFRVILNEHLRAIQEARFLQAAGRSRQTGRRATATLTTLVPHPPTNSDAISMSSAAGRSMSIVSSMRNAQEVAVTSVTTRLAQSLKSLDAVLNRRAQEAGLRLDVGSTARSLVQMKFQVESQSPDYLVDLNERFDRENPSLTVEDEEKRKVGDLLTHLLSEDKGGALFWDQCLFPEIWLKFGFLGPRNELRFVNKSLLLKRVCELCNLHLTTIDLSDPQNISVGRDAVRMVGPLVKLVYPSSRVTELSAGRFSVVHMKKKHPTESLNTFDAQESLILQELREIEQNFRAEDKKKKGMSEAQARLHMPLLAKLERLYQYRGEERRGDHELTVLQVTYCQLVLFYCELRRMWERFGLDGILYVTCPSCGVLFNCTICSTHKCDIKAQWSRKIAAEVLPLGLSDGKLPNSCISGSSEMAPFFCARFARLGMTHGCWRPSGSLADEHLLISLPFARTIVAMELQGGDGKFITCFQIQFSLDGKSFSTYTQSYRHRDAAKPESVPAVKCSPRRDKKAHELLSEASARFESSNPVTDYKLFVRQGYIAGNSDDKHVARVEFIEPFKAQFIRVVVGNENKETAALRMELFYESHPSTGGNPGREGQSERVAQHHVMWDALVDVGDGNSGNLGVSKLMKRRDLAEKELQMLKALDEMSSEIMDVPLLSINVKPDAKENASDYVSLIRTSSEYPATLQKHIALLQSWGPERSNDIQVMVYELLRYRLAEIRLHHEKGRAAEARSQMANYMLELLAALGPLGTKTTLIAPIMVLTRDVLTALGALSNFLDSFFQVARWAARCRHKLLTYILSVLIDSAAASPSSSDRIRVSAMCTELMDDDSMQLASQLDAVYKTERKALGKSDGDDEDSAAGGGARNDGKGTTSGSAGHHASARSELLAKFPLSPLARAVFDQMKARAALMEVKGCSTRPPEMTYPDWN